MTKNDRSHGSDTIGDFNAPQWTASKESAGGSGIMVAVPGRICIMGEHSDWSGGVEHITVFFSRHYTLTPLARLLHFPQSKFLYNVGRFSAI